MPEQKAQAGINLTNLLDHVEEKTVTVESKINQMKEQTDSVSIADMFEMQMIMNQLAQASEMSTSVVSASHSAISSIARNVKG